jgi:hypothetical protein
MTVEEGCGSANLDQPFLDALPAIHQATSFASGGVDRDTRCTSRRSNISNPGARGRAGEACHDNRD